MAKKKKYYVVWEGNEQGIFDNWTDCQLQIKGYPGARYKSFKSKPLMVVMPLILSEKAVRSRLVAKPYVLIILTSYGTVLP